MEGTTFIMNEKIKKIQQEKKKAQIMIGIFVVGLLFSLILTFRRSPLATLLLGIMFLFYVFVFRRQAKQYQNVIKTATLEECLRPYLKEITYEEKNGLKSEHISESHFLPVQHDKSILIRDTVRGTYQALPAFLSDVTCDYTSVRPVKHGNEKPILDFISGNWFEIRFSSPLPYSCTIWDKQLVDSTAREPFFEGFRMMSGCQAREFENKFFTYTKEAEDFILPEEVTGALLKLAEFTPGQVAAQLDGPVFRIFIRNRFLYTNAVSPKVEITPQLLQHNQYPEISYILRVADAVRKMG